MIRKLTIKTWIRTSVIVLICLIGAVALFSVYGPTALKAWRLFGPKRAVTDYTNDVLGTAIGAFFAVSGVFIFFNELKKSVKKRVRQYLEGHREVTLEQLDNDFAAAERIDTVWIGRRWTYSHELECILVENDKVAWVYSETRQSGRSTYHYLCLGLADGTVEKIPVSQNKISRMKEAYERFPHMVVGNNPEYGYMFKHDREAFLNLKYRNGTEAVHNMDKLI